MIPPIFHGHGFSILFDTFTSIFQQTFKCFGIGDVDLLSNENGALFQKRMLMRKIVLF